MAARKSRIDERTARCDSSSRRHSAHCSMCWRCISETTLVSSSVSLTMSRHRPLSDGMALIPREQSIAQHAPGSMETNLGGRLGDAQLGGDLVVGQFVDI